MVSKLWDEPCRAARSIHLVLDVVIKLKFINHLKLKFSETAPQMYDCTYADYDISMKVLVLGKDDITILLFLTIFMLIEQLIECCLIMHCYYNHATGHISTV